LYFTDKKLKKYNIDGGIPVKQSGEMDFSNYVYLDDDTLDPWEIKLSPKARSERNRAKDIREAWKEYEDKIPAFVDKKRFKKDHVWHHTDDGRLQLVNREVHDAVSHHGGIAGKVKIYGKRAINFILGEKVVEHLGKGDYAEAAGQLGRDYTGVSDVEDVANYIGEKGNRSINELRESKRKQQEENIREIMGE
jgi:hypothetical protein